MSSRAGRFLTILHRQHLKAKGYREEGRDFIRELSTLTEIHSISGVKHNSGDPDDPWGFYLHTQILFRDLPPALFTFGRLHAHWIAHAERLAGRPLTRFEILPGVNEEELAGEIAVVIDIASRYVSDHEQQLRAEAIERNTKDAQAYLANADPAIQAGLAPAQRELITAWANMPSPKNA